MRVMTRRASIIAMFLLVVIVAGACADSEFDEQRKSSIEQRVDTFERAESAAPEPQPVNFPIRKALVKFTERQDLINHPWYIYVMGMDGTYVGYFVGQTYPVNACNFLSSTEQVRNGSGDTEVVLTAPSLDGIYYGGGGASSACNVYFFFDVTTDAMQTFSAPFWFAADAPLALDVPRLSVQQ